MFKRLFSAALIFGAAAMAPPALAQTAPCMPRDALVGTLATKFSETLAGGGLQNEKRLIEVWRSETTGSFTIFLTRPDGTACVLATGAHWQDAPPTPVGSAS